MRKSVGQQQNVGALHLLNSSLAPSLVIKTLMWQFYKIDYATR